MSELSRGVAIADRLRKARQDFGPKYPKKFGGAAAIEILRDELRREGIETSGRDVDIRGISSEIDLIVPKVTFKDTRKYKWAPSAAIIGSPVCVLAWHAKWHGAPPRSR